MGSPLIRMGSAAYAKPAYNGGETWLQIPSFADFCTTAEDDCTPPAVTGESGTCTLSDSACWWHLPDTFVQNCSGTCATSAYAFGSGSSEPPVTDPHPPVCTLNTTAVPTTSSGAPIIVSAQVGLGDGATPLNDVGCPATENWSNNGSFAMSYGTDPNGDPIGAIDTHQLSAGLGGYILFTHTEDGTNSSLINVGTWTPNLPSLQYYTVMAHIPATGVRSTDAQYEINPGDGDVPYFVHINQDIGTDTWVSLGTYGMENGGNVQLTNLSSMTPGDYDVGYDALAFVPRGGSPTSSAALGGNPTISQAPGGINPAFLNCTCGSSQAGDPVDTGTGYFSQSDTDLSTPGRGMPLDFTRSYASALADPNGLQRPLRLRLDLLLRAEHHHRPRDRQRDGQSGGRVHRRLHRLRRHVHDDTRTSSS
jgi:hypothetical protein